MPAPVQLVPYESPCPYPGYCNCQNSRPMGFIPISSHSRTTAFTAVAPSGPRLRRGVSFAPTVRFKTLPSLSHNSEEKGRLYYSKAEMQGFYAGVKEFYASHPDRPGRGELSPESSPSSSAPSAATPERRRRNEVLVRLDADPNLRGLELSFYPTRARDKTLALKSLLRHYDVLCADKTLTEERRTLSLAAASSKLSYWSKLVAAETGRLDAVRAYSSPEPPQWSMRIEELLADEDGDIVMSLKRRIIPFDVEDGEDEPLAKRMRS